MRASFWVLGPLLARCGEARVSLPGGCAIGTRPVDLHLLALERLGAETRHRRRLCRRQGAQRAQGKPDRFSEGLGRRDARRPHGGCRSPMATRSSRTPRASRRSATSRTASSRWAPRSTASAARRSASQGVSRLHGAEHTVIPDRIETGTYAMAAAMTGGDVRSRARRSTRSTTLIDILGQAGVEVRQSANDGLRDQPQRRRLDAGRSGDPTLSGLPDRPPGAVHGPHDHGRRARRRIRETIFENRFMHVQELARLGADISPPRRHCGCRRRRRSSRARR